MILLDTNVVSALMSPDDNAPVIAWINAQPRMSLWTTSVTVLEIRYGLLIMPEGKRRTGLLSSFEQLLDAMLESRILSLDRIAAEHAAEISAARRARGKKVDMGDTQIAGIALAKKASLATRNTRHFDDLQLRLVNPWED